MSGDLGVRLRPEGSAKAKTEALQQARQCRTHTQKIKRTAHIVHRKIKRMPQTVYRKRKET